MSEPLNPRAHIPQPLYDQALAVVAELLDVVPDDELPIYKGYLLDAAARKAMQLRRYGSAATRADLLP